MYTQVHFNSIGTGRIVFRIVIKQEIILNDKLVLFKRESGDSIKFSEKVQLANSF